MRVAVNTSNTPQLKLCRCGAHLAEREGFEPPVR